MAIGIRGNLLAFNLKPLHRTDNAGCFVFTEKQGGDFQKIVVLIDGVLCRAPLIDIPRLGKAPDEKLGAIGEDQSVVP